MNWKHISFLVILMFAFGAWVGWEAYRVENEPKPEVCYDHAWDTIEDTEAHIYIYAEEDPANVTFPAITWEEYEKMKKWGTR